MSGKNYQSDVGFEFGNLSFSRKESKNPVLESSQEMTVVGTVLSYKSGTIFPLSSSPFTKKTTSLCLIYLFLVKVVFSTSISVCLLFFFFEITLNNFEKTHVTFSFFTFLVLVSGMISLPAHLNPYYYLFIFLLIVLSFSSLFCPL